MLPTDKYCIILTLTQYYFTKTFFECITHWGRVTHICVSNLTIIASNSGLSPGRRQAIIWTNAGILSIGPLGTNFIEISIEIHTFSIKKMSLKMSSAKWRLFRIGLNVIIHGHIVQHEPSIGPIVQSVAYKYACTSACLCTKYIWMHICFGFIRN